MIILTQIATLIGGIVLFLIAALIVGAIGACLIHLSIRRRFKPSADKKVETVVPHSVTTAVQHQH